MHDGSLLAVDDGKVVHRIEGRDERKRGRGYLIVALEFSAKRRAE